jgi:hypothetical protein
MSYFFKTNQGASLFICNVWLNILVQDWKETVHSEVRLTSRPGFVMQIHKLNAYPQLCSSIFLCYLFLQYHVAWHTVLSLMKNNHINNDRSNGKAVNLYLEGALFDFRPRRRLSWLRSFARLPRLANIWVAPWLNHDSFLPNPFLSVLLSDATESRYRKRR